MGEDTRAAPPRPQERLGRRSAQGPVTDTHLRRLEPAVAHQSSHPHREPRMQVGRWAEHQEKASPRSPASVWGSPARSAGHRPEG